MFNAQKKSVIIVHHSNTKECAEFLQGLIGELSTSGISVNAVVKSKEQFASMPDEQKAAKQKIIYLGYFPEGEILAKNIRNWQFDKFGIKYGWHGNRAIISFPGKLTEDEFKEMAAFAESEVEEYKLNMLEQVEKRGLNPLKRAKAHEGKVKGGVFGGAAIALFGPLIGKAAALPIIGKIALGVGAFFAAKVVVAVAAGAAVGAIVAAVATKDKLNTEQIREQQRKFGVLHFYLKRFIEFMGIKEEEDEKEGKPEDEN